MRASGPSDGIELGKGQRSQIQSIDRAAAILRCFTDRSAALTLSSIARTTGLSTSTTHRLLASMAHNQIVRQTPDRRYTPGPLLIQLFREVAVTATLRDAALPAMTALRDEVNETVGLHALLPTDERVVVDQIESHQPLRRTYTEIGVPIPLPYGAPGKILLAFLPEARSKAVLNRPMRQVTQATVTDTASLLRELAEVRRIGYAMSFAERTPGINTVAGPIFGHEGVVGCLSISGPELRMPVERMRALGPRVGDTARTISEGIGAQGETMGRHSRGGR